MDVCELGKVRRSAARNLLPLSELSLRAVVLSLPRFCLLEEPFACLPRPLMTALTETERRMVKAGSGALYRYRYKMHCTPARLIAWNTEQVYLEAFGWEQDKIQAMLDRISDKCQESLQALYMSYCSPEVRPSLLILVPRLRRLRKLEINGQLADDSVLEVVGASLTQLRELNVDSHSISDKGIRYLCVEDRSHGKCQLLEVLNINSANKVTSAGILVALENLSELKYVAHREVVTAVFLFSQKYRARKLSLEGDIIGHKQKELITTENIELFLKIVPNIKKINFIHEDLGIVKASVLFQAKKIQQLDLTLGDVEYNFIRDLIMKFNSNLRIIKIDSTASNLEPFDISLISKYCPNLEILGYECRTYNTPEYSMKNTFTKLKNVLINDISGNFPTCALQAILQSENLEIVHISKTPNLSDEFLQTIFAEAINNHRILSSLKYLRINSVSNVSLDSLKSLVCFAPHLTAIEMIACENFTSQDAEKLTEFFADLGLGEEIKLEQ